MAVFQISRIQIRRGQIKSGTSLPQLASGEMAWAIDTQELYIGNGSVSEGAPGVGNTKVLTQNDLAAEGNLLGLLQYTYKANDATITTGISANDPVTRPIQTRLDDSVTSFDFGTLGNYDPVGGSGANDTTALQRAIDQLYLNATTKASANTVAGVSTRVVLQVPPGNYRLSSPLFIPSYTSLIGSGADKTILYYVPVSSITGNTIVTSTALTSTGVTANMLNATITGTGIAGGTTVLAVNPGVGLTLSAAATTTGTAVVFTITLAGPAIQFVNDNSTIGNPDSLSNTLGVTQPRSIQVSDLTIHTTTGQNACLQLDAVRDSIFENLNLQGDWADTYNPLSMGIAMNAVSALVTCEHNIFRNIKFTAFSFAVFAKQDILNNIFEDCYVTDARQGFALGIGANGGTPGQQFGPRQTQIINCKFNNVKFQGVMVEVGTANTVVNCKFINVGNNGAGNAGADYPQIYFKTYGNSAENNQSDRGDDLSLANLTSQYVPEMSGHGVYKSFGSRSVVLGQTLTPVLAFRLPVSTDQYGLPVGSISYNINYFYKSTTSNFSRSGIILITANITNGKVQLSDEYNFAGTDTGNTVATVLDFSSTYMDEVGALYTGAPGQLPATIAVNYSNNLTGDAGYFSYSYTAAQ